MNRLTERFKHKDGTPFVAYCGDKSPYSVPMTIGEITHQSNPREILKDVFERLAAYEDAVTPKPLEEWHEDIGPVLWWTFPIVEPPYCGSPLCDDWPGYHTHWTPSIEPVYEKGESQIEQGD